MDSTWASLFIPHRSVVLLESFEGLCLRIYHILTSSLTQAKTIQDHLRRDPTELCDTYTHNSPPQCFLIILSRCFSWCTWAARGNIKGQWRRIVIWAFFLLYDWGSFRSIYGLPMVFYVSHLWEVFHAVWASHWSRSRLGVNPSKSRSCLKSLYSGLDCGLDDPDYSPASQQESERRAWPDAVTCHMKRRLQWWFSGVCSLLHHWHVANVKILCDVASFKKL